MDYSEPHYPYSCWCGGAHAAQSHLTSTWTWPSTTWVAPEFSDTGYVGKHRA